MNNQILEQAKNMAHQSDIVPLNQSEEYLEKAETILLEYLKNHLTDTDAWLLLTRIECNSPFDDHDRITHYAGHVLSYDPTNAYALLFLAYADYYLHGEIEADTFSKLCLAKNDDPEIMAMIEVAKARYFESFNKTKYEQALQKSVDYSLNQQTNCTALGIIYWNQGKKKEGLYLIKKGIANTKVSDYWDSSEMECWLNYYYKGTQVTQSQYDHLLSLCD